MSFLTSSGVFLKKDTKSFVRYSTPEKYCEYGVHQVGLCLSHLPRGGGGGVGSVTEQSRVMHNTRGRGYSTKFYTGRLRPEVQPLTLLYTIFDRKRSPFVYLSLQNDPPFTYLLILHPFSKPLECSLWQKDIRGEQYYLKRC